MRARIRARITAGALPAVAHARGSAAHTPSMETNAAGSPGLTDQHLVKAPVRQPGDSNRMWTVEELVAYLGVPYETFRSWRKNGRGPANEYRFGQLLRYAEEDVVAWIAGGCGAKPTKREPVDSNVAYGW